MTPLAAHTFGMVLLIAVMAFHGIRDKRKNASSAHKHVSSHHKVV